MSTAEIRTFFSAYEQAINGSDNAAIAALYDATFLFGTVHGTRALTNGQFVGALPQRQEFLASVGHRQTRLESLEEAPITASYTLVTAVWAVEYRKDGADRPVQDTIKATYVLARQDGTPKIVLQVDHQDLFARVKELGLT